MVNRSLTGRRAWVTGGLGFIGSNLALGLLRLGAEVTIVDPCVEGCGGNPANLEPHLGHCRIVGRDIADAETFASELATADLVFNLAGEISHSRSQREPMRDLELNTISQLRFLQVLARVRPGVRVVYAGTRQVYGRAHALPVNEDHPIRPTDYNGVHKRAAENYHLMLSRMGVLDAVVLRLTNTYGPRLALQLPGQGFLSAFLRRALNGERIEVFGDGSQLRDPVHVDDVTDAFIRAALAESPPDRVFNVGGPEALTLLEIARLASLAAGSAGSITCREFPAEHLAFDIGSYQADITRIRAQLGWAPTIEFAVGIRATLNWFEKKLAA